MQLYTVAAVLVLAFIWITLRLLSGLASSQVSPKAVFWFNGAEWVSTAGLAPVISPERWHRPRFLIRLDPCQHNCSPVTPCHRPECKITGLLRETELAYWVQTGITAQRCWEIKARSALMSFHLCAVLRPPHSRRRTRSRPCRGKHGLCVQTAGAYCRHLFLLPDGKHLLHHYSQRTSP